MRLSLLLLQSLIGFAFSDYLEDLRIHQENVAKLKCDLPEASSNNSSLSENMLTRLGLVLSDKLNTDGDVKLILLFDMEAAITKCGCGAKNLRFAVLTIVGNGKVAVEKLDAPNSPGTIKFGAATVEGACGASVPIYGSTDTDGRLSLYTTKTDDSQTPIFYGWPIPQEKKIVQVRTTITTQLPTTTTTTSTTSTTTTTKTPETTTKKREATTRKPIWAPDTNPCNTKADLSRSASLFKRLETTLSDNQDSKISTDGKLKLIAQDKMEEAIEKCGCGAKDLRYAVFKVTDKSRIDVKPLDTPDISGTVKFGVASKYGACGARVPIYAHNQPDPNAKVWGKTEMRFYTAKSSPKQTPLFYSWPALGIHGGIFGIAQAQRTKVAEVKLDAPEVTANTSLSEDMLKRLGTKMSGGLITDGKVKLISPEHMDQAVKKCGSDAVHIRYATFKGNDKVGSTEHGYTVVDYYKSTIQKKDAQIPAADISVFGIVKKAGACGATVPVYERYEGLQRLSTTKITGTETAPDFYAWP